MVLRDEDGHPLKVKVGAIVDSQGDPLFESSNSFQAKSHRRPPGDKKNSNGVFELHTSNQFLRQLFQWNRQSPFLVAIPIAMLIGIAFLIFATISVIFMAFRRLTAKRPFYHRTF